MTAALTAFALGCLSDPAAQPPAKTPPPAGDLAVAPSSDDQTALQTALIEAKDGNVLCVLAGTYHFTSELCSA